MASNDDMMILALHCVRCDKTRAWISVYDMGDPPAACRDCQGQLNLVHGREAAAVFLSEAAQWGQMAIHAMAQAQSNVRFQNALTRQAFLERDRHNG